MLLAKLTLDNRNRITLPRYFMEANDINDTTHILIKTTSKKDEVTLKFVNDNPRDTKTTTET